MIDDAKSDSQRYSWMGAVAALVLLVAGAAVSACSSNESPERTATAKSEWLNEFGPFDRVETFQGHEIGIREDLRAVYAEDCQVAADATSSRGKYGDGPRPPGPGQEDYVHSYRMACRDGALQTDLMP